MSVLIETNLGDIVIDLYTKECPITCKNFLKLCQLKYYNGCIFYNVQKDFLVETGDSTNTGKGGDSFYGITYGLEAKYFEDEIHPKKLTHKNIGTVATANKSRNQNDSRFYITTRSDIDYLDEKHTVFGQVVEGLDVLEKINNCFVQEGSNRPLKNIRIHHTILLDNPYDDSGIERVPMSPQYIERDEFRPEANEDSSQWDANQGKTKEQLEEELEKKDARSRSEMLEILGVLPDADVVPPEHVLFVCKLNPNTKSKDLFIIFSQCGKVLNAEVIRDAVTGDSLCYAFIEFSTKEECERAYLTKDNIVVDDRRIHVDFSQSVAKMKSHQNSFQKFIRARAKPPISSSSNTYKPNNNEDDSEDEDARYTKKLKSNSNRVEYQYNTIDKHVDSSKNRDDNSRDDRYRHDKNRGYRDKEYRDNRDRDYHEQRYSDRGRDERYRDERNRNNNDRGNYEKRDRYRDERGYKR
ncbi:Multidomain cyclophilin type peptidyl-prolyl cis-trans isomerase [Tieghemostelium lacteum]|uniref:Peptidyl-prolyl cis-trans isomerase n=1 Tax=Tieghemostelium lacteum TaxID=361077 RepID=A0A151ZES3_TIELA|nr:Multidomain cyclophilin type peptidyl-prolyl cis-trans isomerase [Tieghemostelium lacteum]|eukprot:KYQ92410.1 Multidomain cyclophilin type peptidyl-prolyl cis-trans isomerase [Tieghemostelium lacteum]